ncbi:MAG: YfhO family protein [Actinobacteria bacterium]|nr:YfhO family protein [Actinomycetota bacterium]
MKHNEKLREGRFLNGKIQAAVFLLLLTLVFFWKVVFLGKALSPADLIYNFYPWSAYPFKGFIRPSNPLLSDQVLQFYPWMKYSVSLIKEGILPLWNPYSASGTPFIANYQSAFFYPFNVIFYLIPIKYAFGIAAIVKLFIAGFSMYLLAGEFSVSKTGALFSAVVFMFSGFLVVWVGPPITNAAIWLPLVFLLVELSVKKREVIYFILLSFVIAIQYFGGHIETSFHILLVVCFFILFRVWNFLRSGSDDNTKKFKLLAVIFLFIFLGTTLAAVQIVPFLEYLKLSWSLASRINLKSNPYFLPGRTAITLLVPKFYGNPVMNNFWGTGNNVNFAETTGYVGILSLFFVFIAIVFKRKSKEVVFFSFLTAFSLAMIYRAPLLYDIITALPGFKVSSNSRFLLMYTFSAAILSGIGIDVVLARKERKEFFSLSVFLVFISIVLVSLIYIAMNYEISLGYLRDPFLSYVKSKVYIAVFLIFLSAFLVFLLGRTKNLLFKLLAFLLIILDLFVFGMFYNPTLEPKNVFPSTNGIKFLSKDKSLFRVVSLGETMPVNLGLAFGIAEIRGFDALIPERYQKLLDSMGYFSSNILLTRSVYPRLFNLLNAKYIITDPKWPGVKDIKDIFQGKSDATYGEIFGSNTHGQTFISRYDNLSRIDIKLATYNRKNSYPMIFHLKSSFDSPDLVTIKVNPEDIKNDSYHIFKFSPIPDSKNKTFYFFLESPNSFPGNGFTVWATPKDRYKNGVRSLGHKPAFGDLDFATFYFNQNLKLKEVYKDDIAIYENKDYLPRAYFVNKGILINNDKRILKKLRSSTFNLKEEIIVKDKSALKFNSSGNFNSKVKVVKYEPNSVTIKTTNNKKGFLVLGDTYYPGWKVFVDGNEEKIYRVNYTFRAVGLSEGSHLIKFVYDPLSFKAGLFLSLGTFVLLIVAWVKRDKITKVIGNGLWV